jgi:hypothetical protein
MSKRKRGQIAPEIGLNNFCTKCIASTRRIFTFYNATSADIIQICATMWWIKNSGNFSTILHTSNAWIYWTGQYTSTIGFNPGSQMVQIAGIAVLDGLDHYIKERLRSKYYLRYMDDFILLSNNRMDLEKCKMAIAHELDKIGFEFNTRKTKIFHISAGLLFLGFIFRLTDSGKILMRIDPANVKRERKKLFRLVKLAKQGKISKAKVYECYESWKNHASKGNSHKLIQRMDQYLKKLWED